jgi:hypothetical protein
MNNIYILPAYDGVNLIKETPVRYFKGETEIIYDMSQIEDGIYTIVKINVDFNDGSTIYKDEYDYIDNGKLTNTKIVHKFHPSNQVSNLFFYPTLKITFSNFDTFTYQTPIRITKDSFYSKYENLELHDMQFVDNSENSLFVTLNSINGDILNLKIK